MHEGPGSNLPMALRGSAHQSAQQQVDTHLVAADCAALAQGTSHLLLCTEGNPSSCAWDRAVSARLARVGAWMAARVVQASKPHKGLAGGINRSCSDMGSMADVHVRLPYARGWACITSNSSTPSSHSQLAKPADELVSYSRCTLTFRAAWPPGVQQAAALQLQG